MTKVLYHVDLIIGSSRVQLGRRFYTLNDIFYAANEECWSIVEIYATVTANGKQRFEWIGTYNLADDNFTPPPVYLFRRK